MGSNNEDNFKLVLGKNKDWAHETSNKDPSLFPTLASGQHPQILWIGCSDSRIPETTVLGLKPGDVFVHRNIANILHPGDLNASAVIEYAVVHLKVKHIVVCGHTSCGGVNAALANQKLGIIDNWLLPLRKLRLDLSHELSKMGPDEKVMKIVEANVLAGAQTLMENPSVIDAMAERGLKIHGLVYDLKCGELKELPIHETEAHQKARTAAFETKAE